MRFLLGECRAFHPEQESSMRIRTMTVLVSCAVAGTAALIPMLPASGATATEPTSAALASARSPLPANDGWAATGAGTTGGAAADDAHIFVVTNRTELVAALGGNNTTNLTNATPKIIFIKGKIDFNTDDQGNPLTCADYDDPGYSLDAYLAAYDPATWGRVAPSGPLEEARVRSAN